MKNTVVKTLIIAVTALFFICARGYSQEDMIYNCERYIHDWDIPDWAAANEDYVSPVLSIDENFLKGSYSGLKLTVAFSGDKWSAGMVEAIGRFDLTLYKAIACRIYLPKSAPKGIQARIIISVGDEYTWMELKKPVSLSPGRYTSVRAGLRYGNNKWKTADGPVRMTDCMKEDIRKVGIRIESNTVKYEGPVYIDNIHLVK